MFVPAGLNQIAENFPIVTRLSRSSDRAIEPLQPACPLIIEPRFSAKANDGRTTVAFCVAIFDKMPIATKAGSAESSAAVNPISLGSSPSATSALTRRI